MACGSNWRTRAARQVALDLLQRRPHLDRPPDPDPRQAGAGITGVGACAQRPVAKAASGSEDRSGGRQSVVVAGGSSCLACAGSVESVIWVVNGFMFTAYHLHEPWVMPTTLLTALVTQAYPAKRFQSIWISLVARAPELRNDRRHPRSGLVSEASERWMTQPRLRRGPDPNGRRPQRR